MYFLEKLESCISIESVSVNPINLSSYAIVYRTIGANVELEATKHKGRQYNHIMKWDKAPKQSDTI